MRSQTLFSQSPKAVRPRRPVALMALLSCFLPGSGHVLLGETRLGLVLFGVSVLALPVSVLTRNVLPPVVADLAWLVGRVGVLTALFALIDAPLRAREPSWSRSERARLQPRFAAYLDAVGYGVGHWRMHEKPAAWIAFVVGGALHVGLVLFLPVGLTLLAETVPLLLAWWAYRSARSVGGRRGDESRPLAWIPAWIVPVQATFASIIVIGSVVVWIGHYHWLAARTVDRSAAVALEPYYRNPEYGVQLEMRAPGWSFREIRPDQFFDARHPAELTRLEFALVPRVPGRDGVESAETSMASSLERSGASIHEVSTSIVSEDAVQVRGTFLRGDRPFEFAGLCVDRGFRRYLLRMEWESEHAEFAWAEWDFALNGLTIEGVRWGTVVTGR